MRAPVLEAMPGHPVPAGIEPADGASAELFRVLQDGEFAGRRWRRGQVLVCQGAPRVGDAVVLVARGRQGRPRLGSVQGTRFLGPAGEPCHPARWRAAGRVAAAIEAKGEGEVVDLRRSRAVVSSGEGFTPVEPPSSPEASEQGEVVPEHQLSLFAA